MILCILDAVWNGVLSRYIIHDDHVYVWDGHEGTALLGNFVCLLRNWLRTLDIGMDSSIGDDWTPTIVLDNVKDRFLLFITHLFWIIFVLVSLIILYFFIPFYLFLFAFTYFYLFLSRWIMQTINIKLKLRVLKYIKHI